MWRWSHKSLLTSNPSTSVIETGCEILGRIHFVGTLVLNGRLAGELVAADMLLVGEQGAIEADVRVGTAVVSGEIKGNIVARERVELRGSARIFGDIESPVLVLEEGVLFEGRCRMTSQQGREAEKVQKREGPRAVEEDPLKQRNYA